MPRDKADIWMLVSDNVASLFDLIKLEVSSENNFMTQKERNAVIIFPIFKWIWGNLRAQTLTCLEGQRKVWLQLKEISREQLLEKGQRILQFKKR